VKLFSSRLERYIGILVIVGITVPVLAVSQYSAYQIRSETLAQAERDLMVSAKAYGMQLAGRMQEAFIEDELSSPWLALQDKMLVSRHAGVERTLALSELLSDVEEIADVRRCVHWVGEPECGITNGDDLSARWTLRLVSLFTTDLELNVIARLPKSQVLRKASLQTQL